MEWLAHIVKTYWKYELFQKEIYGILNYETWKMLNLYI